MLLAPCFLHWEQCLRESLPGMYPEGQAAPRRHGRKCFGGCVCAKHDPEVLQRLVKLCTFLSVFPARFQVSLRQGLCLIHLSCSAHERATCQYLLSGREGLTLLLCWCPLALGTAARTRRSRIHTGACELWCSSTKGSKGPRQSPAAPGNRGLRFFTTPVLAKS